MKHQNMPKHLQVGEQIHSRPGRVREAGGQEGPSGRADTGHTGALGSLAGDGLTTTRVCARGSSPGRALYGNDAATTHLTATEM